MSTKQKPAKDEATVNMAIERGKRLEKARDALFSWQDHDDANSEFYVKNNVLIDRRNGKGIAALIEYLEPDRPKDQRVAYVVVHNRFASMFSGVHLTVETIPPSNMWDDSHETNINTYNSNLKEIYEDEGSLDDKAQAMLATRRQMLIYSQVFKKKADINWEPSEYERLLVTDAKLMNIEGQYITALGEFIAGRDAKKKT